VKRPAMVAAVAIATNGFNMQVPLMAETAL
jgi:hypothetical protein